MHVVAECTALREAIDGHVTEGSGPAFVPTMGALHAGHRTLIRRAREIGRPVVVSIFVNPTQFGPGEDFSRYPRTFKADLRACEEDGVDLVFAPAPEAVYPPGAPPPVPDLPEVATRPRLEDAHRPGHLAGVCQVVAWLLDAVRPRSAAFGEKDYQQMLVISAMVRAEAAARPRRWPGLRIERVPTVREADGLALSSRNRMIRPEQRPRALGLTLALQAAGAANHPATAEMLMRETLDAHGLETDYAVIRDAETLMPVDDFSPPTRGLIAARLGSVRLIDNRAMPGWS